MTLRSWLAAAVLAALFAVIYLPALGHGFVKDDFHWIVSARVESFGDILRIFSSNTGFYRPLITLSFAIDSALSGLDPRGFADTNLVLLAADAVLLFALARQIALPSAAALFAVAVWAFNFHGVNMALLWTSGRTALLLCLFALASAIVFLRGHRLAAGMLAFAAMLCKEEAVMLPPLLLAIDLSDRRLGRRNPGGDGGDVRRAIVDTWPAWIAAAVYALLRLHSGAFGPLSAPPFYRLTLAPSALLVNIGEYLDRGATWAVVAAMVVTLAAFARGPLTAEERRVMRIAALWFVAMYAITVLVVVRSSLYALAPSIGSALIAGALASRSRRLSPGRFALAAAALIVVAAALVPVYRTRNGGFVDPADLSTRALDTMREAAARTGSVDSIVLIDDQHATVKLEDAFGALIPDAVHLFIDPRTDGRIVTSPQGVQRGARTLVFELKNGGLIQAP